MNDDKVNKYMANVEKAIRRHFPESSIAATDIYNRCYEAVFMAIMDAEKLANTKQVIDYRFIEAEKKVQKENEKN